VHFTGCITGFARVFVKMSKLTLNWSVAIKRNGLSCMTPLGKHRGKLFVPTSSKLLETKVSQYSLFDLRRYTPYTYASNLQNESVALANRALKVTPLVEKPEMRNFVEWVKANVHKLLPGFRKHWPASFESYIRNSNASPSVKAACQRAKIKLNGMGVTENSDLSRTQLYKWTTRKAFIKMENNLYSTPLGNTWKPPRLIQGLPPEGIALMGPTFMTIQSEIKRVWGLQFPVCFTSGVSAINAACHVNIPGWKVFENDVSSWDASMCADLGYLECWLANWMGAGRAVVDLMVANVKTHGWTTHGCKYSIRGTRKSGDPFTSCFNSLINGFLHLYCFVRGGASLGRVLKHVRMLVQGDDNLLVHHPTLKPRFDLLASLGFKADNIYRKHLLHAEFCSCRVFALKDGRVAFGPKLGRVLLKLLCFVEPPLYEHCFSVARGVALGFVGATSYVPGLRRIVVRILELTSGHKAYKPRSEDFKMKFDAGQGDYIVNLYHSDRVYAAAAMKSHFIPFWKQVNFGDVLDVPCHIPMFERDTCGPVYSLAP